MTDPDQKQKMKFLNLLQNLKNELQAQYNLGKSAADTVVLDQARVGRLTRMDAMQQQKMAESNQKSIARRLQLVNAALAKFDSEDYGYCESCGEEISSGRLEVQPEAPFCLDCQSAQEYHPQS